MNYYQKYLKYKNKYLELKNQIGGAEEKVLILCHPKIVTGSFNPLTLNNHWYGLKMQEGKPHLFEQLFSEYNLKGIPTFETVDPFSVSAENIIKFNWPPDNVRGTYIEDAFSDEFINKHIGEYYLVMVPDCGGRWYTEQSNYPVNKENLLKLCLDLTKMVKKDGFIQFGKFLSKGCDNPPPPFFTDLDNLLKQNSFDTKIKCVSGATWCLIAHKL